MKNNVRIARIGLATSVALCAFLTVGCTLTIPRNVARAHARSGEALVEYDSTATRLFEKLTDKYRATIRAKNKIIRDWHVAVAVDSSVPPGELFTAIIENTVEGGIVDGPGLAAAVRALIAEHEVTVETLLTDIELIEEVQAGVERVNDASIAELAKLWDENRLNFRDGMDYHDAVEDWLGLSFHIPFLE